MASEPPKPSQYNVMTSPSPLSDSNSPQVSQMKESNHSSLHNRSESFPDEFHPSSYERGFITSANVGILLCSLGILFNGTLFTVLCRSKTLRLHYLYLQISSIALADLSFIVMVDSFTIYFEMQPWRLGAQFCKTWMILDVALPAVSLVALLLLNMDRVLFTYMNKLYYCLMRRPVSRMAVILSPWLVSGTVVCSLWLGFPEVEPQEGLCVYGITEEANSACSWLMVFLPSLLIFVLIIFIFIAFIGEMPPGTNSASEMTIPNQESGRACQARLALQTENITLRQTNSIMSIPKNSVVYTKRGRSEAPDEGPSGSAEVVLMAVASQDQPDLQRSRLSARTGATLASSCSARTHRRFIAALLAVDFFSLAITLPYSAYSLVNPVCTDAQSCASLRYLFQTLSWMRSSAACVRPLLFILLTDIWSSTKHGFTRCYRRQPVEYSGRDSVGQLPVNMIQHIQLHEQPQTNGYQGNRRRVDTEGATNSTKHFDGYENAAQVKPGVSADDSGECAGYTSRETSVTMTNCLSTTPPSSPSTHKGGGCSFVRDTNLSTNQEDKIPKMFALQNGTAATAL